MSNPGMSMTPAAKPMEVADAREIAAFYGIPVSVANMMFVNLGGALYPKEYFLLYVGHKRGIQAIEITEPVEKNNEWRTKATIYPKIDNEIAKLIFGLPKDERETYWTYYTRPVVEWGRASKETVRMTTMHPWLPEISIKRAVCRNLRLFAGVGQTAYEELPDMVLSKDEAESTRDMLQAGGNGQVSVVKPSVQMSPPSVQRNCACGHADRAHYDDNGVIVCVNCATENNNGRCSLTVADIKSKKA